MWRDGVEMMEHEERYEDLTALFEAQDEVLQSDAFVARVMTPIKKRSRWRTPLLFGAGGIGIGAAVSQIGGVWDLLKSRTPELDITFDTVPAAEMSFDMQSMWIVAASVIMLACAAIVATERA
ncbi:MAG: hypothetical protein NXH70_09135 [Hyphomonas sp.]|nr:hypothetical protein [Hyphomonas sp.]